MKNDTKTCTLNDVVGVYTDSKNHISVTWDGERILTFAHYKSRETSEIFGENSVSIDIQTGLATIRGSTGNLSLANARPLEQTEFSCTEQNRRISCNLRDNRLIVKITSDDTDIPGDSQFVSSRVLMDLASGKIKTHINYGDVGAGQGVVGVTICD